MRTTYPLVPPITPKLLYVVYVTLRFVLSMHLAP